MAKLSILKGTTSKRLAIFVQNNSVTTGAGLSGLVFNSAGLTWYYWREDAGNVAGTSVTLATATRGTFTSGGFVEKDATNMPGWYEIGVPDAALASGASWVGMSLRGATNMAHVTLEIELTSTSNQDGVRGGMTALPNAAAEAAGGLYTRGSGAGQLNQQANGQIDVNAMRLNNVAQSLLDLADFADDGYDPTTNKIQGVVLTDTLTTYTGNTPQTGDSFPRIGPTGSGLTTLATAAALATVQADTDDIQTRLPAALTGAGHIKSDALALDGSTTAATNLKQSATVIYVGSVTGAATTTTLIDSALTQADTDFWKGRIIIFLTGTLKFQATNIAAFDPATDKLTFTALTQAPSGADTYVVL